MSSVLDDEIEVTGTAPGGLDYIFPRRQLGPGQCLIWLVIGIMLGLSYWLLGGSVARLVRNGLWAGNTFWAVLGVCLTFLLWRSPLWFSLGLLFGHREVGLHAQSLFTGERIGPWRRCKSWPLNRLKRLQIVDLLPVVPHGVSGRGLVRHLHVLTGVLDDGKRIVIAPGYPRSLLDPFVADLSRQLSLVPAKNVAPEKWPIDEPFFPDDFPSRVIGPRGTRMSDESVAKPLAKPSPPAKAPGLVELAPSIGIPDLIAEAAEALRKAAEPDVYDQPPGSDVQVEWVPGGITIRVPPVGVGKERSGLFQGGIIWCVTIAGFTLLFLMGVLAQDATLSGFLGLFVVMTPFWLIGAWLLWAGWNNGNRESVVAVAAGSLTVLQTVRRRTRRREWPCSEITSVRAGLSDMEVNDETLLELQLLGAKGKLFGMLAGRDKQELLWMATLLRKALREAGSMSPKKSPTPDDEWHSDAIEPVAQRNRAFDIDYRGMTIDERLLVARLSDHFAAAVGQRDRSAMLQLLHRVQLPEAGAEAYVDEVLAEPHRYGF